MNCTIYEIPFEKVAGSIYKCQKCNVLMAMVSITLEDTNKNEEDNNL